VEPGEAREARDEEPSQNDEEDEPEVEGDKGVGEEPYVRGEPPTAPADRERP
jgi:hypothetical protein